VAGRKAKATSGPWRVLVGLNYPPNDQRVEPGEIVDDLPAGDAASLLEQGIIEPVAAPIEESA
jgi:hypothetical protein